MPEGTPKHQPQPKLPTEALRAPSPKGTLFEERDLEETLPPPMLLEDKVQILFTLQKNPKVGSRGLLRRVSGEPTEAESGSETSQGEAVEMTGGEANSTSHSVYHLADCHLESSTSQAAEAEFQRLGLSQQSTAATGRCLTADPRPVSRASSLPQSLFSRTGRSSALSFRSDLRSLGSARLETPPSGDRAFEAHAALVKCPAPRRASRAQRHASLGGRSQTSGTLSSAPTLSL